MDVKQKQTQNTFGFKWNNKKETYESDAVKEKVFNWLVERYFGDKETFEKKLTEFEGKDVLDAGCGNGHSMSVLFGKEINSFSYSGVDIADGAIEQARTRFEEMKLDGHFTVDNIQTMKLGKKFDYIFSEGVIHHTSEPRFTFDNLVMHLKPGGKILFYIYKKKAPIREFTDDHVRKAISNLSNDEAWEKLIPLTQLGKTLGELNTEITVPEDIELLEIPKGTYNLQRFFYWFFMKAYYDPNYSIDEMNHINFDWYSPQNCYRFEPEEIKSWIEENELTIERFVIEEAGITVIATKATNND